MEHIGGHAGLDVLRDGDLIVKRLQPDTLEPPYTVEGTRESLAREASALKAMSGSGYAPELVEQQQDYVVELDVGETQPVEDVEEFRRNCIRMLAEIRRRGLRHGDLTSANIVVVRDWPWVVDWQEAHWLNQEAPQKQPWSDSYLLFRGLSTWKQNGTEQYDLSRTSRRWLAVLKALGADGLGLPLQGKSFLDLGCFQGDFCAVAACERMVAMGVDIGGFRSGEDSVEIGWERWKALPDVSLVHANIMEWPSFDCDVVMMFSTWPYLVQQTNRSQAEALLERIVSECGVLFFETQLYGDGPGPTFLQNDDDVGAMLGRFGQAEKLVTLAVWGRDANRSIWKVKGVS